MVHPQLHITARVIAPSVKRGKTVLLDYLSRNGYIEWWDRSRHRQYIIVHRDTGQENVDVVLHYTYGETSAAPQGLAHGRYANVTSPWKIDWKEKMF